MIVTTEKEGSGGRAGDGGGGGEENRYFTWPRDFDVLVSHPSGSCGKRGARKKHAKC